MENGIGQLDADAFPADQGGLLRAADQGHQPIQPGRIHQRKVEAICSRIHDAFTLGEAGRWVIGRSGPGGTANRTAGKGKDA